MVVNIALTIVRDTVMNINSVVRGTASVAMVTDTTFAVVAADTEFVIGVTTNITSVVEVISKNFTVVVEDIVVIKGITTAKDRLIDCLVVGVAF